MLPLPLLAVALPICQTPIATLIHAGWCYPATRSHGSHTVICYGQPTTSPCEIAQASPTISRANP